MDGTVAGRLQAGGDHVVATALRPWARRLALETLKRWLARGAMAALAVGALVLAVGWLVPWPETELRPLALRLALAVLAGALLRGLWPVATVRRAGELDARLGLADRLATAWLDRGATRPMAQLQRAEMLARLSERSPDRELPLHLQRRQLAVLALLGGLAALLILVPSPMVAVLNQQAAEQLAVQRAAERVAAVRQEVAASSTLTPEQARRLDELLRQTQAELSAARHTSEAAALVARAQEQVSQVDAAPAAADAPAAMSETLAQEPLTQPLADALQRSDAQAADDALRALASQAGGLSDAQRQALARALQRAANVGRDDPRTASALRDAAQALASGQAADAPLQTAASALGDAVQAGNAQATLRSTAQQLRALGSDLASVGAPTGDRPRSGSTEAAPSALADGSGGTSQSLGAGSGPAVGQAGEARTEREANAPGGGVGAAGQARQSSAPLAAEASEDVFVPGRAAAGPTDDQAVQQPLLVRGQPRPYQEVLGQYAQSGREYVEHADVPPAVREVVKQYFADLEGP